MKIIDLTMPLDQNTPACPGYPKPRIEQFATIAKEGWNEKRIEISTHSGTHLDAPFHMFENGKRLDEFPVETFIAKAIVIEAQKRNEKNEIIVNLEKVKENDAVLFCTRNSEKMQSEEFYKNNPVVSLKTAQELTKHKVKIVGIDSYTIDDPPFESHKELLSHDILLLENLVNLPKLIGKRFETIILPLKIANADGAPCRVIALVK